MTVADTTRAVRVLETSHPPAYYIPPADVREDLFLDSPTATVCEYKGGATYVTIRIGQREVRDVAWRYRDPLPGFEAIRDAWAFYPARVDEAWVGDERARAQGGGFYGGWITSRVVGPFKGEPETIGW